MNSEIEKNLGKQLLENGFIDENQLKEAENEAVRKKISLSEVLVNRNIISDKHLGQFIANMNNWEFVELSQEAIDSKIITTIPESFAKKQNCIAYKKDKNGVHVAMNNPSDTQLIHLIKKSVNENIITKYATKKDIYQQLKNYKTNIANEFEKIINAQAQEAENGDINENATIRIVNLLLTRGYESNASDIHIEPNEINTNIRFRIDGVMKDIIEIPQALHEVIISRIKVMAHLRTDEHQKPQDGKIQYEVENETMDIRVSIVPTTKGENAVMRLLAEKNNRYSLSDLGLQSKEFEKINNAIKKPWGMILITGPTGSGKTTSLYAMLQILNKREVNIATIEDPVEYNIDGVTQIQVNNKAQLTFSSGLKSLVRQDPDIIMVGEIRDEETAEIAVNSAMTGHLVLSTLHTNDAATTIPRILDMGIEPFLVSSTINIAIGQRLLRKICQRCIHSYETDLSELSDSIPISILEELARGKDTITIYKGTGCPVCNNTGYHGRTGVFEILEMDDTIRKLIMSNANADTIKQQAIKNGMVTMFEDAKEKVLNGITTIEELLRVIKS